MLSIHQPEAESKLKPLLHTYIRCAFLIKKIRLVYTEKHKLHKDPAERHVENPWRIEDLLSALKSGEVWSYVEFVEPPAPDYF